jgi:hypothetical protein
MGSNPQIAAYRKKISFQSVRQTFQAQKNKAFQKAQTTVSSWGI